MINILVLGGDAQSTDLIKFKSIPNIQTTLFNSTAYFESQINKHQPDFIIDTINYTDSDSKAKFNINIPILKALTPLEPLEAAKFRINLNKTITKIPPKEYEASFWKILIASSANSPEKLAASSKAYILSTLKNKNYEAINKDKIKKDFERLTKKQIQTPLNTPIQDKIDFGYNMEYKEFIF